MSMFLLDQMKWMDYHDLIIVLVVIDERDIIYGVNVMVGIVNVQDLCIVRGKFNVKNGPYG